MYEFNTTFPWEYTLDPRPRFLLFGDSITQFSIRPLLHGFDTMLEAAYSRRVDVINRGLAGYTTRTGLGMLPHIIDEWKDHKPSLMIVFFGANDAILPTTPRFKALHVPLAEYVKNLKKIVQMSQTGFPEIKIVLVVPPPVDETRRHWRHNNVTSTYAKACMDTAKELGLMGIDTFSIFQKQPNWHRLLLDGLHFSLEGHELMYRVLQQHIVERFPEYDPKILPQQYH